jgi:predicted acetylornithine/succinylornithine family transaminase
MSASGKLIELHNKYVMPNYTPGLALAKGKGARVWDLDGKEYLDFLAGISVLNVGHCHPKVTKAIQEQAERLVHVSNLYYNENQPRLAEKLSTLSLGGKCFFCNSGAEANEGLIKLARLWGHQSGKFRVVSMRNSFHGRTIATAAATGQVKVQKGFEPMPDGFDLADFNDLGSVEATIQDTTAAVLLEAVQGEGGIIPADQDFIQGVRALCDEKGILMLCDEVQCGMGRTGHWFGFQAYGVQPDAFSLAKALGNGYPIGAVVTGDTLADVFQPGTHASTFGGTPLACAAALATIEVIENEDLLKNARDKGALFTELLQALAEKHTDIKGVRGMGLMLGLMLEHPAKEVVNAMTEMGLIAIATADVVVRFLPPLNVTEDEIKEAVAIVDKALAQ